MNFSWNGIFFTLFFVIITKIVVIDPYRENVVQKQNDRNPSSIDIPVQTTENLTENQEKTPDKNK